MQTLLQCTAGYFIHTYLESWHVCKYCHEARCIWSKQEPVKITVKLNPGETLERIHEYK